jgi:23S rRNA (guanine745-N1)-methyltransferase
VIDDVLHLLPCPHCGAGLARRGGVVRCSEGHSFDLARQGYLSLLAGSRTHAGDTAPMVAARDRFLAAGHFDPLADALAEAVPEHARCVVDLGAGTGWYLARALDRVPGATGLALELSKPALRRAARAHPRIAAVGCDVWAPLPIRDGVADAVVNVFAPRNAPEVARVLGPGGVAVVVTPTSRHLGELVGPLGLLSVGEGKDERLGLDLVDRHALEWPVHLDHAAMRDLVAMGPSAFHVSAGELDDRIAGLPQALEVTAAVTITRAARPR